MKKRMMKSLFLLKKLQPTLPFHQLEESPGLHFLLLPCQNLIYLPLQLLLPRQLLRCGTIMMMTKMMREACSMSNQKGKLLVYLLHLYQHNRRSLQISSIMTMKMMKKTLASDSNQSLKHHLPNNYQPWALHPKNNQQTFSEGTMMRMKRILALVLSQRPPLNCLLLQWLPRRPLQNLTSSITMMTKRKTQALI